jgi:hypothetical protein|tara:strand:- start:2340 stop:2600 length:261 start_codon:yes stop_codon:yes gene_type:complete
MAYWTHTKDPIGAFVEKEVGNHFEFSLNDRDTWCDFPHKIWVGDVVGQGYRYGTVKKTVAYIAVDEDEFGLPVVEKWAIKNYREYN